MKSFTFVSVIFVCTIAWFAVADDAGSPKSQTRHEPNSGYVSDAATALEIGKVVLGHLLTPDAFHRKEFSEAKLKDGIWTVSYWEPKTEINFPVVVQIRQKTGAIIKYEDPNS
jgi:hypothetical protein